MAETITPDICVIGGGSGGLSVAAAAAAFGVSVVLIEQRQNGRRLPQHRLRAVEGAAGGGQARRRHAHRASFRRAAQAVNVDFAKVHDHVQRVIARDRADRFGGAIHRAGRARDQGRTPIQGSQNASRSATITKSARAVS